MFTAKRQEVLDKGSWVPGEEKLGYLEIWRYPTTGGIIQNEHRHGFLKDEEIEEWTQLSGRFATKQSKQLVDAAVSLRLLFCEREGWSPLGFCMSKQSFLAVERAFNLPPEVLPVLDSHGGREYCNLRFSNENNMEQSASIALTIKTPQLFQVGNLAIVVNHSFKTRTTVGLVHGWHIFTDRNVVSNEKLDPHVQTIFQLLDATKSCLSHPLHLPLVLLNDHLNRGQQQQSKLSWQATQIEKRLGMTKSGRNAGNEDTMDPETRKTLASPEDRMGLIMNLNTTSTDLINLNKLQLWDRQYAAFLRHVNKKASKHMPPNMPMDEEMSSMLHYLDGSVESDLQFTESLSARMILQHNTLYNFIASTGNDLNSRIATTTGLDGTAMKTLAFVTMIFLPPSFIATLFSMSMFDWQAPVDSEDGTTVVPNFWIYWAVSAPLTISLIIGWRVWWHYQKNFYEKRYENPC